MNTNGKYVASLDIGTSTVRCLIIDKHGQIKGQCKANVNLQFPKPGFVEIVPNELWETVLYVIRNAVLSSNINFEDLSCLGISCQRNSFILWNRFTNKAYHNFITWNDIRGAGIVKQQNISFKLELFRFFSKLLYLFTRKKRFLVGSMFKLTNNQIAPRLLWVLENIPEVTRDLENVVYGTVDTWLLHKFSGGNLHVTDVSNASASGLFDPFTLSWSCWPFYLFNIPQSIFPPVVDSAGSHFGAIVEDIFGCAIPICCSIADQSASLFGSCCFNPGDTKVTLGTGTFLDVNTGSIPYASFKGLYPLVAWRYNGELVYMAEGASNDTGVLVKWAHQLGLFNDPGDSANIAQSVQNNGGVYFVPAFSGLQAPVNDADAGTGFIGLKPTSKKSHLLRAILESIVYRVFQLFQAFYQETDYKLKNIRVDGGVSRNEFVMQMLSDMLRLTLEQTDTEEMSALGAAFLAGLSNGFWLEKGEFNSLIKVTRVYNPGKESADIFEKEYKQWSEAINRFTKWYS